MLCRMVMSIRYFLLVVALHNYDNIEQLLAKVSSFLSASSKTRVLLNSNAVANWVRYHCNEVSHECNNRGKVVSNVRLLYYEWERAKTVPDKQRTLSALVQYIQYVNYSGRRDFLYEYVAYTRFVI
ncbi:hypothetical protein pEaSNUABM54_00069 [Erwinia phage pEa_SNUABM_54]|nr:hypothetical protein pEaSNUABM54_00069 [Erwinia phage pEa_SNUABM_54]